MADGDVWRKTLAPDAADHGEHPPPHAPATPWERHAAAQGLPRFDYTAPSSLLSRPRAGFLVTCPIKREKSATKEVISFFHEFIADVCHKSVDGNNHFESATLDEEHVLKRRKVCCNDGEVKNDEAFTSNSDAVTSKQFGEADEQSTVCKNNEESKSCLNLSLVKLQRSGLLLFTFFDNNTCQVVDVLWKISLSLTSGKLKRPEWCHRILPIQETCLLVEEELHLAVSKLFKLFLLEKSKLDKPVKFAVGYNRRGIDELEMKSQKKCEGSDISNMMDRDNCFRVVASAITSIAKESTVDLKSPEVAVFIEVLPISGMQGRTPIVGVSVLPDELITTKPRLSVRPLIVDAKTKGSKAC